MIRAILFDMDGTLVDAFPPIVYALNRTLAALGRPQLDEAEIRRHTGKGSSSIRTLFGEKRDQALELYARFHDERLFDLEPLPGAAALLRWARDMGIGIAVVTSKSQSRAELQLEHLGWTVWIDAIVGLTGDRLQKPDPHTLHLACADLGIAAAEAGGAGDAPDRPSRFRRDDEPLGCAALRGRRGADRLGHRRGLTKGPPLRHRCVLMFGQRRDRRPRLVNDGRRRSTPCAGPASSATLRGGLGPASATAVSGDRARSAHRAPLVRAPAALQGPDTKISRYTAAPRGSRVTA